jgi:hypothetical protein
MVRFPASLAWIGSSRYRIPGIATAEKRSHEVITPLRLGQRVTPVA